MDRLVLDVEPRAEVGTHAAHRLRRTGLTPAVIYGRGEDALMIAVESREFSRLLSHEGNLLLDLRVRGADGTPTTVMVKEVQRHPVSRQLLTVDFLRVSLTEKVTATVALVFTGEAEGQKRGGILEQMMHEVEVECLPGDIPAHLEMDISALGIGDALHLRDLIAPAGVAVLGTPDDTVVLVAAPIKEEAATAVLAEEGAAEPEVIAQKGEREEEKG
jgi:large subunit ribosomal protein L25